MLLKSKAFAEKSKISQLIRRLVFVSQLAQKQNLVEDIQFLLLIKFCQIKFNGFREVKNALY